LFVSAKGLEPDETGAFFPAQLIYTQPERGNQEQFDLLADQYDEKFQGGFAAILQSLQQPALTYGRAIGEIDWQRDDNDKWLAPFIWSRDPEEYLFSPPGFKPGLYKKNHTYSTANSGDITLMPPGRFMFISYNSLYNNPYGQAAIRPLAKFVERWESVFDDWTLGLKKAALGAWIGEYDQTLAGESTAAVNARALYSEQIGKISNSTHSIFDARNNVRSEKLDFEAQSFLDFHTAFVQTVSILLTGSATALIEGKFGSFAKEEATSVRQKSDLEQSDAMLLGIAFTEQFNKFFLHINFAEVDLIPQLQLIRPELITPTTPEGQQTQEEITVESEGEEEPEEVSELQEEEKEEEEERPVFGYPTFPSEDNEPDIYFDVTKEAEQHLDNMPVKAYRDVTPEEAPFVFTVKRLRTIPNQKALLTQLKNAVTKTLFLKTEADAWKQYIREARSIFQSINRPLTIALESDLITSFRQTRQRAFQAGIDNLIENSDELHAIRIETRGDSSVRPIHQLWDGVILKPDDPRVQQTRCPMDFECRCNQFPVFKNDADKFPLTPESDIPETLPGQSYKHYVLPQETEVDE